MPSLSLVPFDHPILQKNLKLATREDLPYIKDLIPKMAKIMMENNGVGLAANQVNIDLSFYITNELILTRFGAKNRDIMTNVSVYINPSIIYKSRAVIDSIEGCLSNKGFVNTVKRHYQIEIEYRDINWDVKREVLSPEKSIIAAHEIDHLVGKTIWDN